MLDMAFRAIAEPRRRDILGLIQSVELPAGKIASHFDVTRPAISQHLKVLADAELVTVRREGAHLLYRARPEGLAALREFLDRFWDVRLQQLKRESEAEERRLHSGRPPRE